MAIRYLGQVANVGQDLVLQQNQDIGWQALEKHVLEHQCVFLTGEIQLQEPREELGAGPVPHGWHGKELVHFMQGGQLVDPEEAMLQNALQLLGRGCFQ